MTDDKKKKARWGPMRPYLLGAFARAGATGVSLWQEHGLDSTGRRPLDWSLAELTGLAVSTDGAQGGQCVYEDAQERREMARICGVLGLMPPAPDDPRPNGYFVSVLWAWCRENLTEPERRALWGET